MTSSSPRPCSDDWNACAVPWKLVLIVGGRSVAAPRWSTAATASPSEAPGSRLKEMRDRRGAGPEWLTVSGPTPAVSFATASSGTSVPLSERT